MQHCAMLMCASGSSNEEGGKERGKKEREWEGEQGEREGWKEGEGEGGGGKRESAVRRGERYWLASKKVVSH